MPSDDMLRPKTMHDVKTSRDVRLRPIKSSQQVFRTRDLIYPVDEHKIAIELLKEKRRFVRQAGSLARMKKKIEHTRAKLYDVRERNRRLVSFRYQLQKERWAGQSVGEVQETPEAKKSSTPRVRTVRIRRG